MSGFGDILTQLMLPQVSDKTEMKEEKQSLPKTKEIKKEEPMPMKKEVKKEEPMPSKKEMKGSLMSPVFSNKLKEVEDRIQNKLDSKFKKKK